MKITFFTTYNSFIYTHIRVLGQAEAGVYC